MRLEILKDLEHKGRKWYTGRILKCTDELGTDLLTDNPGSVRRIDNFVAYSVAKTTKKTMTPRVASNLTYKTNDEEE